MELIIYLCFLFAVVGVADMFHVIYKDVKRKVNAKQKMNRRKIFKAAVKKVMKDFRANEERKELMQNALLWSREVQGMYAKGENR